MPSGQGKKHGYSLYSQLFTEFVATHDVVATLHHEPRRALLVDWTGDSLPVTDTVTGEIREAYLFVASCRFRGPCSARGLAT
ncbi:hypothetical protein BJG92_01382 [Arthrobacter sp. SO5]|uniref:hypothetical protein n=1 Tax=Arthrobacter sp. SO5 TaxID=1897055 RepID=UPI001E4398B8|nr:hypothetical protein [Arthrobacter sp. SO5]MCB5273857.1 hypothetical protein [Arthrobacter sp. SO5]